MADSTAPRFGPAAWAGLLFLIVYTLSVALVPIRSDNDVWWHVKSGLWIIDNGIPKHDVFNFNAAEMEWHNHEWLSQVLMGHAWQIAENAGFGGFRGVILFIGIIITITTVLIYFLAARLSRSWLIALLLSVLCVAIGRRMFYPRPPVITNLMLVLELWLLVAVAEGWLRRRWLIALPIGIALWTNLHGGWMAGGVVFGAWWLEQILARVRPSIPFSHPLEEPPQVLPWKWLIALPVACLLATLCNPYHIHLYALPGRVLSDLGLVRAIGELHSPDMYFVIDFELAVLGLLTLAFLTRRFRPRLGELMIALFFLHQALQHVRHLSLFSILMIPLAARLLGTALAAATEKLESVESLRKHVYTIVRVPVAVVTIYLAAWVLVNPREGGEWTNPLGSTASYPGRNIQFLAVEEGYIRSRFPAALCDLVELADLQGRMFNTDSYAGYLIWRLAPEPHKVYSDSRFDIFGGALMRRAALVAAGSAVGPDGNPLENGAEAWQAVLDHDDVQWLIVGAGSGLESRLMTQQPSQWAPAAAWPDSSLAIWIRRTDANEPMLERTRSLAPLTGGFAP